MTTGSTRDAENEQGYQCYTTRSTTRRCNPEAVQQQQPRLLAWTPVRSLLPSTLLETHHPSTFLPPIAQIGLLRITSHPTLRLQGIWLWPRGRTFEECFRIRPCICDAVPSEVGFGTGSILLDAEPMRSLRRDIVKLEEVLHSSYDVVPT